MLTPKKNEKRPTFLNRADNADWAPHQWRLANGYRFELEDFATETQTIMPISLQNQGDMLQLFFTRDIEALDSAASVVEALRSNPEADVDMEINSRGGSVDQATAMFNALVEHQGEVTARVTGMAGSSAMFLSQAADTILINQNAKMFLHPPHIVALMQFGIDRSNTDAFADFAAENIDKGMDQIVDMLSDRSGQTGKKIRGLMTAKNNFGTTLNAKEAVELGFADEIISTPARTESVEPATRNAAFRAWREVELANCAAVEAELT